MDVRASSIVVSFMSQHSEIHRSKHGAHGVYFAQPTREQIATGARLLRVWAHMEYITPASKKRNKTPCLLLGVEFLFETKGTDAFVLAGSTREVGE